MLIRVDEDELCAKMNTILDAIEARDMTVAPMAVGKLSTWLAVNEVEEEATENA